jgi:HPt (histidine-containing phosphotransfer) domain-containing protein
MIPNMTDVKHGIDWEQLDMIADGFTEDFVEIYREFEVDLPRILGEVEAALKAGDPIGVSRAAHQAKGSAANFGFVDFSALMARIEQSGKAGAIHDVASLLADGREAFQSALATVKAERNI